MKLSGNIKRRIILLLLFLPAIASAGNWTNSGCNAQRNGMAIDFGPTGPDLLWSGGRPSLIAWLPVTEGNRVFMVRQKDWASATDDSPVVAMDLLTGTELWTYEIPFTTGDWTTWIAGVYDGQVYASRSGNGASILAKLYALDATDGSLIWISVDDIDAGFYDGVVFAPDGDPVIASFRDIWRINATDGTTVWHSIRTASVSGTCGGAIYGDAFYVADSAPGGQQIVRFDLNTGARMYQSPVMAGFLTQTTPFCGPDGTVYFNRSQNNPVVDFYYAFTDTGTGLIEKWHIPSAYGVGAEYGIGPDGSLYLVVPGTTDPELARIDPDTGDVLNTYPIPDYGKAHIAVDPQGYVFFSNGEFAGGRLYAFTADLIKLWDVPVTNINIGGPSLGNNGVLVVCGISTDVRAYRSVYPTPTPTVTPAAIPASSAGYTLCVLCILGMLLSLNVVRQSNI